MSNLKNESGQGLVEYILIVVVMALLAIGGIRALGKNAHNAFVQASDTLNSDMNDASTNGASGKKLQ